MRSVIKQEIKCRTKLDMYLAANCFIDLRNIEILDDKPLRGSLYALFIPSLIRLFYQKISKYLD